MSQQKWDSMQKDSKTIYKMGDFTIEPFSTIGGGGPMWIAQHQGQEIHRKLRNSPSVKDAAITGPVATESVSVEMAGNGLIETAKEWYNRAILTQTPAWISGRGAEPSL